MSHDCTARTAKAIFENEVAGIDFDSTFDTDLQSMSIFSQSQHASPGPQSPFIKLPKPKIANQGEKTVTNDACAHKAPGKSSSTATSSASSHQPRSFLETQYRYRIVKRIASESKNNARFDVKAEDGTHMAILELYDSWLSNLRLSPEMLVNIVDVQPKIVNSSQIFVVNRNEGYLVIEPDILVSITSVVGQLWCPRLAALKEFFKFTGSAECMLRGIIAHDLLGRAMMDKLTKEKDLMKLVEECLNSASIKNSAYSLKLSQKDIVKMTTDLIPYVLEFVNNRYLKQPKDQNFKILEVLDIEDSYWSPVFGLKGKVDATVKIRDEYNHVQIVPFEFKTGNAEHKGKNKSRHEHTGQLSLYTLMMRPRYGLTHGGLLLYITETTLKKCKVVQGELQSLIQLRNSLALSTITSNGHLDNLPRPDEQDFSFKCSRCEVQSVCSLLFRASPIGLSNYRTDTEMKLWNLTRDFDDKVITFFQDWMKVITLEIEEQTRAVNSMDLWKVKIEEREKRGGCIGNLEYVFISPFEVTDESGQRCYKLSLKRSKTAPALKKTFIAVGDFVILSTQEEICISYAQIDSMNGDALTVSIERKLNEKSCQPHIRFVIDKTVSTSAMQIQYGYLARLMELTPEAEKLRKYIIFKSPPKYLKFSGQEIQEVNSFLKRYNDDQRVAILKALKTDSLLFVKGMPGTGKTDTIIGLLNLLTHKKHNVLVVAYTNNALDNILLKYKESNTNFIRVGSPKELGKLALEKYSTNWMSTNSKDIDELTEMYNSKTIVGSTLLGLTHSIFQIRSEFDYCIVDEASQALPTVVFGAMLRAKKVIFFGDPDQLPPIIKSDAVKSLGLPDNMFSLVAQPVNTVKLSIQYRMNSAIMKLANKLVYKDQMTCATEELSENILNLPSTALKSYVYTLPNSEVQKLMKCVLSKKLVRSVVFIDISKWNPPEEKFGESIRNVHEATIVRACVDSFVSCGSFGSSIGVIAPFRGQVTCLKELLVEKGPDFNTVEVHTVDQYQGRDKDIIICSFTKSKIPPTTHEVVRENSSMELKTSILEDIRRLNVAVTRAKKKLIMVGNRKTLEGFGPFKALFPILTSEQIVEVDKDLFGSV